LVEILVSAWRCRSRHLAPSPRRRLRRQDPQRRQAWRHTDRATDEVRVRDQHEHRQSAWPYHFECDSIACGPPNPVRIRHSPAQIRTTEMPNVLAPNPAVNTDALGRAFALAAVAGYLIC
jgi:hypothetical protein